MKRPALRKDFYREVRRTLGRFLSIFFIVAMGVAFFAGIRSAEPDMRLSGDAYFDEAHLMDVKAMSTMGLTEEDLTAIADVAGVQKIEGGYSTDALCKIKDSQKVLHIMSDLPTMNQVTVEKGRLPRQQGECLVDQDFFENSGFQIGDSIQVSSGTEDEVTDTLKMDTLKIVGSGNSPCYISFGRGSSSIGTGEVSGYLVTTPESFSLDVYTEAYLQVEDTFEKTAHTKAYDDQVTKTLDRVEDIAGVRCEVRKTGLVEDATKELDKARKELADGKAEMNQKLQEAQAKLADGDKQFADGKQQIADGREALADAKSQLSQKQKELDDANAQYQDGLSQLEAGKQALADNEALYNEQAAAAQQEMNAGEAKLQEARQLLDNGWTPYNEGHEALAAGIGSAEAGIWEIDGKFQELTGQEAQLKGGIEQLEQALLNPELTPEERAVLEENKAGLQAQLDAIIQAIPELQGKREETAALVSGLKEQLAALEGSAEKQQLDAGEAEYEANVQVYNTAKSEGERQLNDGKEQLNAAAIQIADSEAQLNAAGDQITSGQSQINAGWDEIHSKEAELSEAEATLLEKEPELADGKAEYEKSKAEAEKTISENEQKIKDAQEKIDDIENPKWYVQSRDALAEYSGYGDNADRMKAIGQVFPVLFFLVAALISLTSMTRMVEEQRTQIGTLKALGYSKGAIAKKYINYALLATLGGSLFGVLVGEKILPYIIVYAYRMMYPHMSHIVIPYNLQYALMATVAALACTLVATILACYKELAAQPAVLMRPPTPKQGKRVFVERITFFWKHLSFTWKSTIRNLIRYKKRFLMTVFGIGGCMALMIVGFGLKDSIFNIAQLQYEELQIYDGMAILKENIPEDSRAELLSDLDGDEVIDQHAETAMKKIEIGAGKKKEEVYSIVPERIEKLKQFVTLRDRVTKQEMELDTDGAVLTEKTAKSLNVGKGDSIFIKVDGEKKKVKIAGVTENYMGHYLYLPKELYESVYDSKPEYNSIMFSIREFSNKRLLDAGERILSHNYTLNVTYTNDMATRMNDMLTSLNLVIGVLIISAGMLAFVVLYNLNNINITERQRELATIKVLGFYDSEVAAYVYRENILLTLIGAAVGIGMGIVLHRFTIVTVEIEEVMFGRNIDFASFVYSALFTFGFSAFVNWVMYFKLKRIDMVESLKSVE